MVAGEHSAQRHTPGHAAALLQSDWATSAAGGQFAVKPASHVAVTTATPAAGLPRTASTAAAPGQAPSSLQLPLLRAAAAPLPTHKQSTVDTSVRASAPPRLQQLSMTAAGAVPCRLQQLSVGVNPATAPASLSPSRQSAVPASQPPSVSGVTFLAGMISTAITARQSDRAQNFPGNGAVSKQCGLCCLLKGAFTTLQQAVQTLHQFCYLDFPGKVTHTWQTLF